MSAEWHPIDPDRDLNEHPQQERSQNIQIQMDVSPYDVPNAFRGRYDTHGDRFIIEFRYITRSEPVREAARDHGISLKLGKNSGRLYAIEIPGEHVRQKPQVEISLEIGKAVDALQEGRGGTPRHRISDSLELVKDIIRKRSADLTEAMSVQVMLP